MSQQHIDPNRVQFRGKLTADEVEAIAGDPAVECVQTSEPAPPETWRILDEELFSRRPDIELRVFGFYGGTCDLGFASRLEHVRRFAADCLQDAVSVESIAAIPELESLSLGVYGLQSFELLERIPAGLHKLSLGQTRSKKPSLAPLARFRQLEAVHIENHRKDIEVLAELGASLADVTLRSVTTSDLHYLRPLEKLWSLDIKLGGIRDLSAIAGMRGLKYLELWQVRGLSDVSVAGELPGLQHLFLQSLPQVERLPSFAKSERLRRVTLENMKGLRDLSTLVSAPALHEFVLYAGMNFQAEDMLPVLQSRSLQRADASFGSDSKNAHFAKLAAEHGIAPFTAGPFRFE